jgi:hypothetical protein
MTDTKPPFPACYFSMTIFGLSAMIDQGTHEGVTFAAMKAHAKAGDLVPWLKELNGGYFASNFLDAVPGFAAWWVKEVADNCRAMDGRESRKYGVAKNGICLLLSYTAELLQSANAVAATERAPAKAG